MSKKLKSFLTDLKYILFFVMILILFAVAYL